MLINDNVVCSSFPSCRRVDVDQVEFFEGIPNRNPPLLRLCGTGSKDFHQYGDFVLDNALVVMRFTSNRIVSKSERGFVLSYKYEEATQQLQLNEKEFTHTASREPNLNSGMFFYAYSHIAYLLWFKL